MRFSSVPTCPDKWLDASISEALKAASMNSLFFSGSGMSLSGCQVV